MSRKEDAMRLADLDPTRRVWLRTCLWDRFIEKHEGPEDWAWHIDHAEDEGEGEDAPDPPEFITLGGYHVLLPIGRSHHPQITMLRMIADEDRRMLAIFLKDLIWAKFYRMNDAAFWAGFLAVCERAPEADWYAAILYHEIFLRQDLMPVGLAPWPISGAAE
jgi:hypothetical protein